MNLYYEYINGKEIIKILYLMKSGKEFCLKTGEEMFAKYLNNDLQNPKFLFHGSPKILDVVAQNQAHDSNGNIANEDFAVFLTSSLIIASAYAFKDQIKELSPNLDWNFEIGGNAETGEININFNNVNLKMIYLVIFMFLILMIVMNIMKILYNINVTKILNQ